MDEPWHLTRSSFLDETEVSELLRLLRSDGGSEVERSLRLTDRLIVEGLLFSGLRNSEFCSLSCRETVLGTRESVFRVVGTRKQDRTVHVPRFVSELVKEYARDVRPRMLREEFDPDDLALPLLVNERGRPYERTSLYRRVLRILSDIGFGARASVQLLRHTYGYLAYRQTGGNLLFVQRQLGHAHPMVTSVYAEFVSFPEPDLTEKTAAQFLPSQENSGRPRRRRRATTT